MPRARPLPRRPLPAPVMLALLGVTLAAGPAGAADQPLLEPTPLILKDGRIARVSVHALAFPQGQEQPDAAGKLALDGLIDGLADDCFLTAQAIGHVEAAIDSSGDALAAHRLARARADAVQAALVGRGLQAGTIASVWDWQFMVREPRVTLWVFSLNRGEDCEGKPLPRPDPAAVAAAEPPPAPADGPAPPPAAESDATVAGAAPEVSPEPAAGPPAADIVAPAPLEPPAATTAPPQMARAPTEVPPPPPATEGPTGAESTTVVEPPPPAEQPPAPPATPPAVAAVAPEPAPPMEPAPAGEPAAERAAEPARPVPPSEATAPAPAMRMASFVRPPPPRPSIPKPTAAAPAAATPDALLAPEAEAEATLAITFDMNSSFFPASLGGRLKRLATSLERDRAYAIELLASVGADPVANGSERDAAAYNRWIAERRMSRVAEYLQKNASTQALEIRQRFVPNDPSRRVLVRVRPVS